MFIFNVVKKLLGSLSDEDKKKIQALIGEMLKAAAAGAIQGAVRK